MKKYEYEGKMYTKEELLNTVDERGMSIAHYLYMYNIEEYKKIFEEV